MQQRAGDPNFGISSPTNNDAELPNISVWGFCTEITGPSNPSITVKWGSSTPVAALLSPGELTWEAVLSGVAAGPQQITATCANGPSSQVTVVVASSPSFTIDNPTGPTAVADTGGANPWAGWAIGGTYVVGVVSRIDLYITRRGTKLPPNNPATRTATLNDDGTWSLALDSFPIENYRGHGFCLHAMATTGAGTVHGSCPKQFSGPPN